MCIGISALPRFILVFGKVELALIGFVFLRGAEWNIGVTLFGIRGCVGFGFAQIGFVLHNKGIIGW